MIPCLFFALFGLAMGSFLNVCIVRLPLGESVVHPGSHCRQCGDPVAAWDNIPVLSWVFLLGKCRTCGTKVSWQYPLIESATCAFFLICCLHFSLCTAPAWALLCFLLLGLAVIDAQTLLLPDVLTLPGLVAGLIFSALRPGLEKGDWSGPASLRSAVTALLAAAVAAVVLLLIAGAYWLVRRRTGMGMGDVKLIAMLAAWLGLAQAGLVLFLAVLAGALYGVALLLASKGKSGEPAGQLMVPFGTMLSLAGLYSVFLGEPTLHWYLQFFH
jgi:leader peptidase (prepilin peptidase) / N-methyltransferase